MVTATTKSSGVIFDMVRGPVARRRITRARYPRVAMRATCTKGVQPVHNIVESMPVRCHAVVPVDGGGALPLRAEESA